MPRTRRGAPERRPSRCPVGGTRRQLEFEFLALDHVGSHVTEAAGHHVVELDLEDPRGALVLVRPVVPQWHRERSEERRVGQECVSTCSSRWSPFHSKKKTMRPTNN